MTPTVGTSKMTAVPTSDVINGMSTRGTIHLSEASISRPAGCERTRCAVPALGRVRTTVLSECVGGQWSVVGGFCDVVLTVTTLVDTVTYAGSIGPSRRGPNVATSSGVSMSLSDTMVRTGNASTYIVAIRISNGIIGRNMVFCSTGGGPVSVPGGAFAAARTNACAF